MNLFLFIFESIGTSELILIGIIALIFLGPRRLPEIARKLGKIMADLRSTTNEFKETWEREVNFEEEAKALRSAVEDDPVPRDLPHSPPTAEGIAAPEIKQIDASAFEGNGADSEHPTEPTGSAEEEEQPLVSSALSEKKDWL